MWQLRSYISPFFWLRKTARLSFLCGCESFTSQCIAILLVTWIHCASHWSIVVKYFAILSTYTRQWQFWVVLIKWLIASGSLIIKNTVVHGISHKMKNTRKAQSRIMQKDQTAALLSSRKFMTQEKTMSESVLVNLLVYCSTPFCTCLYVIALKQWYESNHIPLFQQSSIYLMLQITEIYHRSSRFT